MPSSARHGAQRRSGLRRLPLVAVLTMALVAVVAVGLVSWQSLADDSSTPTPQPSSSPGVAGGTYVALGDSYTAAPLFPLKEEPTGCLRSSDNYPTIVAQSLDLTMTDVSCSGASTEAMFGPQHFAAADEVRPPQLDALTPTTSLVTVGIGANDYQFFTHMMFDCLSIAHTDPQGDPCRVSHDDAAGQDELERKLGDIRERVARVVQSIRERAPHARILVIGYPQLLPASGECRQRLPLAVGDYSYTRTLNLRLAATVEDAAERAGADYIDVESASQGHDICSTRPWVAGIKGQSGRAMGLHPYPAEQRAVARLILAQL